MTFDRSSYINSPIDISKELEILFQKNGNNVIFEIGACEGEDSIRYARFFPNSRIFAFEPLPKNVELINQNLSKYGVSNVSCYPIALSSKVGKAEFYVSQGKPENIIESDWDYGNKSSSLLAPDQHVELVKFIEFNQKITVDTATIASFCKEHQIKLIDFIHMDVQGAELIVLEGAGDVINSIKSIWLEVSKIKLYKDQPLNNDIHEFMNRNNFVLVKDTIGGDIQGDCLYISKIHFPRYRQILRKIQNKPTLIDRMKKWLYAAINGSK